MTKEDDVKQKLLALTDELVEDLDDLSEKEIREEFVDDGKDPDRVVQNLQSRIREQVMEKRRETMRRAKQEKQSTSDRQPEPPGEPLSSEEKRSEVERLLADRQDLPEPLTAAFREADEMSESDLESLYEELVELGLINPDEGGDD